jgi:hypothetical protein
MPGIFQDWHGLTLGDEMEKTDGITWKQIGSFSVDEKNRLLWNGEVVVTENKLALSRLQLALAIIATIGATLSGIHPFLVSFGIL